MEGRWCEETQREDVHLQAKKREALNWLPSKPYKKPTLKAPTRSLPSKPYKKPTLMNLDFRLAASRWRKNTFLLSLSHPVCGIYSSPSKLKQYVNYTPKKLLPKSQKKKGASLVAQWLRICLPMQGTRVRALVWDDPTCRGATGPMSHNYWAWASGASAPQQERPR